MSEDYIKNQEHLRAEMIRRFNQRQDTAVQVAELRLGYLTTAMQLLLEFEEFDDLSEEKNEDNREFYIEEALKLSNELTRALASLSQLQALKWELVCAEVIGAEGPR